jgi:hypothetical protein
MTGGKMAVSEQSADVQPYPWVILTGPPRVPARFPRLYRRLELGALALSYMLHAWGTTEEDRALEFPCDSYVKPPLYSYYRGIEVLAPREIVFRWLCQLRVSPYGYDIIDNLGRRSPRELTPGAEQLEAGQRVMVMFEVVEFEQDVHISVHGARGMQFFGDVALTYRVVPCGPTRCRIVVKTTAQARGKWRRELFPLGELPHMRKQLLTLKQLAERQFLRELADGRSPSAQ